MTAVGQIGKVGETVTYRNLKAGGFATTLTGTIQKVRVVDGAVRYGILFTQSSGTSRPLSTYKDLSERTFLEQNPRYRMGKKINYPKNSYWFDDYNYTDWNPK